MALHAAQHIGSAFTITREFLTPFDVRRWLKLALVVLFIGGGLNASPFQFNTSSPAEQVPDSELPITVPSDIVTIIAVVVVAAIVLGLVFALLGAIMEFVFIESLRAGDVSIRHYWNKRWRQGLRLFAFRLAIGIPVLVTFVGWFAVLFVPLFTGRDPVAPFWAFLLGLPVVFLVSLVYGLVSGFTTAFVVPLMIQNDSGVLAAWRRLWRSIKAEWKQYLAYAVIGFLLTIAAGFLASIVLGLIVIVLLIPFAIVAGITHVAISLSSTVGFAVLIGLAVLFVAVMIVLSALVQVPIVTYLRYYALLVLGEIEESFDIIPEQRAAIEEEAR
jgi:hypothetical protein